MPWFELITHRCLCVAFPDRNVYHHVSLDTIPADSTDVKTKKKQEGSAFSQRADLLRHHRPDVRPVDGVHRRRDHGHNRSHQDVVSLC